MPKPNPYQKEAAPSVDTTNTTAPISKPKAEAKKPSVKVLKKATPLVLTTLFANKYQPKDPKADPTYYFNGSVQFADEKGEPQGYVSSSKSKTGRPLHYQRLNRKNVNRLYDADKRAKPTNQDLDTAIDTKKPLVQSHYKDEKSSIKFKADVIVKNGFRMIDPNTITPFEGPNLTKEKAAVKEVAQPAPAEAQPVDAISKHDESVVRNNQAKVTETKPKETADTSTDLLASLNEANDAAEKASTTTSKPTKQANSQELGR